MFSSWVKWVLPCIISMLCYVLSVFYLSGLCLRYTLPDPPVTCCVGDWVAFTWVSLVLLQSGWASVKNCDCLCLLGFAYCTKCLIPQWLVVLVVVYTCSWHVANMTHAEGFVKYSSLLLYELAVPFHVLHTRNITFQHTWNILHTTILCLV